MRVMRWFWITITRVTPSTRIWDNLLEEEILGEEDGWMVLDNNSDVGYDNKYNRKGRTMEIVFDKP